MNTALPHRRLTYPEFVALLGLPNQGELLKLRVKCQRGDLPGLTFPISGLGGFLVGDALAFRDALNARTNTTQVSNAQSTSPPPLVRRSNMDRWKL